MRHIPIFESPDQKKFQETGYSLESHYITPLKPQLHSNIYTNSTTIKPPINSRFNPIEHLSKQIFKPPPSYNLGDSDQLSPFNFLQTYEKNEKTYEKNNEKYKKYEKNEKNGKNGNNEKSENNEKKPIFATNQVNTSSELNLIQINSLHFNIL